MCYHYPSPGFAGLKGGSNRTTTASTNNYGKTLEGNPHTKPGRVIWLLQLAAIFQPLADYIRCGAWIISFTVVPWFHPSFLPCSSSFRIRTIIWSHTEWRDIPQGFLHMPLAISLDDAMHFSSTFYPSLLSVFHFIYPRDSSHFPKAYHFLVKCPFQILSLCFSPLHYLVALLMWPLRCRSTMVAVFSRAPEKGPLLVKRGGALLVAGLWIENPLTLMRYSYWGLVVYSFLPTSNSKTSLKA